jgi:SAM-dependent methyltransferase
MYYFPDSNSEAGQESFVLNMLDEKRDGWFLEIGAFASKKTSNTWLLETKYGWKGASFEIVTEYSMEYSEHRDALCFNVDATKFNYKEYLDEALYPDRIDYLQLDIEPASNTLLALKQIPLDDYRFSVITFEHDLYYAPENVAIKEEQKEILTSYGYVLAVENVMVDAPGWPLREFEDWWIDPKVVSEDKYKDLKLRYM